MEVTLANSMSRDTATDWTRNLSLHFASAAGSSFKACSRTISTQLVPSHMHQPSGGGRTLDIDMFTGLNAAGVRANTVTN